jgi:hypothetical protein
VRTVAKLFRDATHIKLRLVGIGGAEADLPWLRAVDQAILLPDSGHHEAPSTQPSGTSSRTRAIVIGDSPGPAGWNKAILDIIG